MSDRIAEMIEDATWRAGVLAGHMEVVETFLHQDFDPGRLVVVAPETLNRFVLILRRAADQIDAFLHPSPEEEERIGRMEYRFNSQTGRIESRDPETEVRR